LSASEGLERIPRLVEETQEKKLYPQAEHVQQSVDSQLAADYLHLDEELEAESQQQAAEIREDEFVEDLSAGEGLERIPRLVEEPQEKKLYCQVEHAQQSVDSQLAADYLHLDEELEAESQQQAAEIREDEFVEDLSAGEGLERIPRLVEEPQEKKLYSQAEHIQQSVDSQLAAETVHSEQQFEAEFPTQAEAIREDEFVEDLSAGRKSRENSQTRRRTPREEALPSSGTRSTVC
jgi:predicted Zn-ribbon and HTH transcriptional regulator